MNKWKGLLILAVVLTGMLWAASASAIEGFNSTDGRMRQQLDLIETHGSTLHLVGWAYDTQNAGATVTIDIDSVKRYTANKAKGSNNTSTCPIGGNHYFDIEYPWTNEDKRVMIHAMYTVGEGACLMYDNIAYFTPNYTVTFNANGGSGAPSSETKHRVIPLRLPSTMPTRTGYTFKGWATSRTGGVAYQAGGRYTNDGPVTLYAVWEEIKYPVEYNANGGTNAPATQYKLYTQTLTLSANAPTREGYIFLGWGRAADSETPEFQPGDPYSQNAALTLYALWRIARVPGDVNGDEAIDDADAAALLAYLADLPGEIETRNADVNNDGAIDGRDALRLMKYLAGQDVALE